MAKKIYLLWFFLDLKTGLAKANQHSLVMAYLDFVPLALVCFHLPALTGENFCPVTQRVFALTYIQYTYLHHLFFLFKFAQCT